MGLSEAEQEGVQGRDTGPFTEACVEAALSPWRPGRATRGVALLKSRGAELLLLRSDPSLPYLLTAPAIGWLLDGYLASGAAWLSGLGAFVVGGLGWTLAEYLMHRFFFHFPATSDAMKVVTFISHGHHHVSPLDRRRLTATPVQLGSVVALFVGLYGLTFAAPFAQAALAGTLAGYAGYEAIHYLAHHGRPRGWLLKAIVDHHRRHHFEDSAKRWGISSPLWDWVFRTT